MNSPTLFVGLGGTGSRIVAKVSEMIPEEQRMNTGFVIIDTDVNDLPEIKSSHSQIHAVQTSARMTVGQYLDHNKHARDSWFPISKFLHGKVLSEGAGQIRAISRLGFESVMKQDGLSELHKAIDELYKVDAAAQDQSLRVTIVSSLAGGTGSGLILPVAMYIRHYLTTKMQQSANVCRGFFVLPEIFYDVIPEGQKNHLRANAYASLRELDAFLMKGSQSLPGEYSDSVKLEFPKTGDDGYEEYQVLPYDYCFLFDAQNADNKKLNSLEQYMDHAAQILFSMSCGPVAKRINSSEDNVIRTISAHKGRNRYVGGGASRLVYPYEDICSLIGLEWASSNISSQWLEYDNRYLEKQRQNLERQEKGMIVEDIDREKTYVDSLKNDAKNEKVFARTIVEQIEREQTDSPSLYIEYLEALKNQILENSSDESLASITSDIDRKLKGIFDNEKDLSAAASNLFNILKPLNNYKEAARDHISRHARDLAYSLFEGAANGGAGEQPYLIDSIVRNPDLHLHPNAVRYLLIKTRDQMQEDMDKARADADESLEKFEKFYRKPAAQLDRGDGTAEDLSNFKSKGLFSRKKDRQQLEEVAQQFRRSQKMIDSYFENGLVASVYKYGVSYLNSLIKAFNDFYDVFRDQISNIDERKNEIYRKYKSIPGQTVRYIAADEDSLTQLVKRYPYTGSLLNVDPSLSANIVDKVFSFARQDVKKTGSLYFRDIFEEQILPHYQKEAHNRVAGDLDQGIIRAIELEAGLKLTEEQKNSPSAVDQYVRDVIHSARKLATPFIERPSEFSATEIDACAYHTSLQPKRGEENMEAKLIQEELTAKGGNGDPEISRNMIIFFKAYYGLRANGLSKFAPPKTTMTQTTNGGEYYAAYMNLIRGICPLPGENETSEITPHLDKSWHLVAKMPDLDENSQQIEEYEINAAFFWALVLNLLNVKMNSAGRVHYELNAGRLGLDEGLLLIDQNTAAEYFYQVFDSLAAQQLYVSTINEYKKKEIEHQKSMFKDVLRTPIHQKLSSIEIPYNNQGKIRRYPATLFHLPLYMKQSAKLNANLDRRTQALFEVAVKETVGYISEFFAPEDTTGALNTFLTAEYEAFKSDMEKILAEGSMDTVVLLTMETAANLFDGYHLNTLAMEIREDADRFRRSI